MTKRAAMVTGGDLRVRGTDIRCVNPPRNRSKEDEKKGLRGNGWGGKSEFTEGKSKTKVHRVLKTFRFRSK